MFNIKPCSKNCARNTLLKPLILQKQNSNKNGRRETMYKQKCHNGELLQLINCFRSVLKAKIILAGNNLKRLRTT